MGNGSKASASAREECARAEEVTDQRSYASVPSARRMINTQTKPVTSADQGRAEDGFRPSGLRQSMGLVERPWTGADMLQYVIEAEYCRENLQRHAAELTLSAEESAKATRLAQLEAQKRNDFLAVMSHEIRTPLNGILGMAAVLSSRNLGTTERDCVETIRSSGEALLAIIDDILDFSKIEAGRLELECAEFDLAQAIDSAIQIVRATAERNSLRLCVQIDGAVPKVMRGDVAKLRQVLLNLLSNAIKFTQNGTIELKTELLGFRQGEYELGFCVTDTGIGISEEQMPRLFQPFSQADVSTRRKFGGTGLGLAISKRLAELMGGSIGMTSRPGEGSSFWFSIKALPCEHAAPRVGLERKNTPTCDPTEQDSRILLVEDNSVNQKVATFLLKSLGYTADVARNGKEAVAAMAAERYDLVLMDCVMPEMDGFEATRRIRAQAGHASQVPIIAMTASAFPEDRDACLGVGMTDYLSKPVREAELRSKLEFWLSGKGKLLAASSSSAAT